MKIGEYLAENGMKPSHFCNKVGIGSSTLYSLLSGETMPSLPTAISIYDFTDGEVDYRDMLIEGNNTHEIHHGKAAKNKKVK